MINIIGLSIGLSSAFVIGAMIYYDLTFDKFHKGGDRIYRVATEFSNAQGKFYNLGVTVPLAEALKQDAPGLEIVSPFYEAYLFKVENRETNKVFKRPENIIYTDKNYFDMFRYQWLAGNSDRVLSRSNEVILTENRAKKYFPDLAPNEMIGKTLVYDDSITANVSGIIENFKNRSDLIFEEFISFETIGYVGIKERYGGVDWDNTNGGSRLFFKLDKKTDVSSVQKHLTALAKEHQDEETKAFGQEQDFLLQPLADLHFNPNYGT